MLQAQGWNLKREQCEKLRLRRSDSNIMMHMESGKFMRHQRSSIQNQPWPEA